MLVIKESFQDENGKWHVYPQKSHIMETIAYIKCPICREFHPMHVNLLYDKYKGNREFRCYKDLKNKTTYRIEPIILG